MGMSINQPTRILLEAVVNARAKKA